MTQGTLRSAPAWLVRVVRSEQPRARLICLPYAGGSPSAFRPWKALPPWLEVWAVRAPGRESRIGEKGPDTMRGLVAALTEAIPAEIPPAPGAGRLPYALYGHSMGAIAAFELAHTLPAVGYGRPAHLFVTGRRPPDTPDPFPGICQLPWDEFIEKVRALEGIPEEVFAEPDLAELVLGTLHSDFVVIDSYRYLPKPPLACGISAIGGDNDITTPAGELADWAKQTTGPFSARVLPGGHFFINTERDTLLAAITADLTTALRETAGQPGAVPG